MPPLYALDPFLAVQGALATPWLDLPMAALSTVCEGWALTLLTAALVWSLERRLAPAALRSLPPLAALLATGLAAQVVKRLVGSPRPLAVLGAARVHLVLEPLGAHAFPSGHAAAAAALAAALTVRYRRRVAWLWGLAALGGVARVYVGAHWVTDVLAGWVLGAVGGALVAWAVAGLALRLPARRAARPPVEA